MPLRTLILLLVLAAVAAFAVLNWEAFTAPTTLTVGFATVHAPLGMIMLGLIVLISLLFLGFVVYLQTAVLIDTRRHARELQLQRELADQAEASRFTDLRLFLEAELKRVADHAEESRSGVMARMDRLDRDTRSAVEQAGNIISAYIGELEERLERRGGGGGSP